MLIKRKPLSIMVLGGGSTGDKGLDHLRPWEEGRKHLLDTSNVRKLIKPFLTAKSVCVGKQCVS